MIGSSPKLSKSECHSCYFHLFFLYPQKQTAIAKIATGKKTAEKFRYVRETLHDLCQIWIEQCGNDFYEWIWNFMRNVSNVKIIIFYCWNSFPDIRDVICGNALRYLLQLNILPFCDAKKWDESVMKSEIRTKNHQLNKWEYIFPLCGWWTIPCGN